MSRSPILPDPEAVRRQLYTVVAALACLIQVGIVVAERLGPAQGMTWEPVVGAILCGGAAAALRHPRVSLQAVDHTILAAATLSVAVQLLQAAGTPSSLPPRLYFIGVFLFIAGFSILPPWWAVLYAVTVYAAFSTLSLTREGLGDLTLLAEMGLIGLLVGHLSIYGRQVSAKRAEARLFQRLALTDTLTGLDNRRAMYDHLHRAFAQVGPGRDLAAVLLDVDHFKSINDHHGHERGDQVLQEVGAALQQGLRPGEHVARWGGEEFLALLRVCDGQEAWAVAERLRLAVRGTRVPGVPPVTASFGVALASRADSVAEWLRRADAELYRAKTSGRDRISLAAPSVPA